MINLSSYGITPSEYPEFKELCNEIYRFVANEKHVNLFKMMMKFPSDTYPRFETALEILFANSSLVNGSKGFRIGSPPKFEELDAFKPMEESEKQIDEKHLRRIEYVKEIDSRALKLLSDETFYDPIRIVEKTIESMSKGTPRTILDLFFIKDVDIDKLTKTYKSQAKSVILNFSKKFSIDVVDVSLFENYNLPTNVFTYLFNRSIAYFRLFSVNFDSGYGDITERLFPSVSENALYTHRIQNSEEVIDLHKRSMDYILSYQLAYGYGAKTFVASLLALLDNTSVEKTRVKDIYKQFSGTHLPDYPSENEWMLIFDDFIEWEERVKYLSYYNIQAIGKILSNMSELNYGISVEKAYKSHEKEFYVHNIDNAQELQDFILKYTTYRIDEGHIIVRGTLKEAIQNFVSNVQVYNHNRLVNMYVRRCGGPKKLIEPLLKTIDMNSFFNENPLTPEEKEALSVKFSEFEWISKDNAESIFRDLHDLRDKFTEINMHELGFTSLQDVYYRGKYPSFSECLLHNEFTGEEKYFNDRKFKLNMECRAFYVEVEYLEKYLHWIPVSKYRYVNLESPKYKRFADVLVTYNDKIVELCKKQFVTPFSLKNITIGIPEIDEDYYDLEFYDAMLIASKANHQTLSGHRFFFIPTDFTSFGSTAPEFIRFIIYNNNGFASIGEIQAILEREYGIRTNMSVIRNQVKLSTCMFSRFTDTAYLDDEMYMEALKNETD
ncbi:hypothetical protein PAA26_04275 [Methanomassiliicoccaceae archaeon COG_1]|nr:hypothetical protein [Methanomassiliicoccaceae archaeon COG_1]